MGKGWAYLALTVIGLLMLWGTGQFDSLSSGSNLNQREAFWKDELARELPQGTSRAEVDAFATRHQLVQQCTQTSRLPVVIECHADDPKAKGGTADHPMTQELVFVFHGPLLYSAVTEARSLEFQS